MFKCTKDDTVEVSIQATSRLLIQTNQCYNQCYSIAEPMLNEWSLNWKQSSKANLLIECCISIMFCLLPNLKHQISSFKNMVGLKNT